MFTLEFVGLPVLFCTIFLWSLDSMPNQLILRLVCLVFIIIIIINFNTWQMLLFWKLQQQPYKPYAALVDCLRDYSQQFNLRLDHFSASLTFLFIGWWVYCTIYNSLALEPLLIDVAAFLRLSSWCQEASLVHEEGLVKKAATSREGMLMSNYYCAINPPPRPIHILIHINSV